MNTKITLDVLLISMCIERCMHTYTTLLDVLHTSIFGHEATIPFTRPDTEVLAKCDLFCCRFRAANIWVLRGVWGAARETLSAPYDM